MRRHKTILLFIVTSLAVAGCGKKEQAQFGPPPTDVDISPPLQQEVTEYREYTGTTAAIETVDILARVKGFLESIHFQPRDRVKRDDLLFVIDPREYRYRLEQAHADLAAKEAALELAEYELKRIDGLYAKSMAAEYERNTAIANRNAAKAAVQAAEACVHDAQLELDFTRVTAPIAGRVNRNFLDVGNFVESEKTVLTDIVNDASIYVYFNVSENDLLDWIRRQAALGNPVVQDKPNHPVEMGLAGDQGFPHIGRIDYADTQVDPGTGTLRVRAIFPNEDGLLLAGLFARVRVPVEKRRVLLVPAIAIGADQIGRYVYVVNAESKVEQRLVVPGQIVGQLRAIESGLKPEDRVVTNGIQRARPGTTVNVTLVPIASSAASAPEDSGSSAK